MKTSTFAGLLMIGAVTIGGSLASAKPDKEKGKGGNKGGGKPEKHHVEKGGGKDDKDVGKGKGKGLAAHDKHEPWRANRFEDRERGLLLEFFRGFEAQPQGLPPGLAKNLKRGKPLPPGWQKKVGEGFIIDDETFGFFNLLEDALFPDLKPKPDTKIYLYGDRVVRVYEPKRQVIDVFEIPSIKIK